MKQEIKGILKTIDILDLNLKNLELNHRQESYAYYYFENCKEECLNEVKKLEDN